MTLPASILIMLGVLCFLLSLGGAFVTAQQACHLETEVKSTADATLLIVQGGAVILFARWGIMLLRSAGAL